MPAVPASSAEPTANENAASSALSMNEGEQPSSGDAAEEGLYDLGYLTEGVASYIASLRERVSRTQADLLTVPAQELRSALQVPLRPQSPLREIVTYPRFWASQAFRQLNTFLHQIVPLYNLQHLGIYHNLWRHKS